MAQINELTKALFTQLDRVERQLQPGDSTLVQPTLENMHQDAALVAVPGYDWDAIDVELRRMVATGLVSTGGPALGAAGIGIFFSRITEAGRRLMATA